MRKTNKGHKLGGSHKVKLVPIEIPDLGIRMVMYGDTGRCKKWDNCFTCPYPVEDCGGGDRKW